MTLAGGFLEAKEIGGVSQGDDSISTTHPGGDVQGFAESLQQCISPQSSVTSLYGSY